MLAFLCCVCLRFEYHFYFHLPTTIPFEVLYVIIQEMKNLKESITKLYLNQIKELQDMLDAKHKELVEASKLSAEQKHTIDDLNGRLVASLQSCTEANEIMSR